MRVSYSPGYDAPLPVSHLFPMKKFQGLYHYLTDSGIIPASHVFAPSEIGESQLRLVHDRRYTSGVLEGSLETKEIRRLGLPWSAQLARRSRLAVSGTLNAAYMALEDGISGNLAGGTHHAFRDHGEGFCVFNDVAVTIRYLKKSARIRHALILDCDAHQGNGSAELFKNDPEVYTFSIHSQNNYPLRKPPSDCDVGLPDGTKDREYLECLEQSLDHVFENFNPDIVFYLGGVDILETDRFGRLSLSEKGLIDRDQTVIDYIFNKQIPLVLLLSGGYAPTVKDTVEAHAHMFRIGSKYV